MNWVERATELLQGNESIQEQIRVGEGGVVVTNNRLLAFTPESEGSNYQTIERPNVEGIDIREQGELGYIRQGAKAAILGVALIAVGYAFNFDEFSESLSFESGGAASAVGVGGMLEMVQTLIDGVAILDEVLLGGGVVALAFGTIVFGIYIRTRTRQLTIGVAGADDVTFPAPEDESVLARLQSAIGTGDSAATVSTPARPAGAESGDPVGDTVEEVPADNVVEVGNDVSESNGAEPVESAGDGAVDISGPNDQP